MVACCRELGDDALWQPWDGMQTSASPCHSTTTPFYKVLLSTPHYKVVFRTTKVRIMQSITRYYYGLLRTIQSTTGSVLRSTTTYTKSCSVLHATK